METSELEVLKKTVKAIEKILYEVKPNLWSNVQHELDVAYSEGKEILINKGLWER